MNWLSDELARLEQAHLYRRRLVLDSPQGAEVVVDGRRLLSFCSNDYLGLANDSRVIAALQRGAGQYGVGSGASHLVTGHCRAHHALEEELADFVGARRALLFSTGFMANLGVVMALAERHSLIAEDRLNHASLIDAARLARARTRRYPHADVGALRRQLGPEQRLSLILTDAVFSMDGDVAPLEALAALAREHGAWLLADDAHGLGVRGPQGRGSLAAAGLAPAGELILMGTLGKAFGVFGAFVAGDADLVELLIQRARSYIYTTALPAAVAEAVRAALAVVRAEGWRRERLRELIARFRAGAAQLGFTLTESETPIQPLLVGEASAALALADGLRARGFLVPAIRPPTVPAGSARLRVSFSAAHSPDQVDRLLRALAEIAKAVT
ncbi:MAG: 8-amino-7-oxononanoate synthase [Acidithiobacillales bacterium SM23_46]|nr:MAG: 8-amino-7-oxononanoate synthase [Acidithiobacillales bacterium SM23_46]KPL27165.1 MAG: 8-amino-7-oxononanoate synthase [Acidithiobacillales bacterium SM1_46]